MFGQILVSCFGSFLIIFFYILIFIIFDFLDEIRISVCHCLVSILSVNFQMEIALRVIQVLTCLCAPECDPQIRIQRNGSKNMKKIQN